MKLSPAQRDVVRRMREGWELGSIDTSAGRAWLQKGGIGRGGETQDVNGNTFYALLTRGIIEQSGRKFPFTYYQLTDLGRTVEIPEQ